MPYLRERTWIQMAPRIPGLSLRESQSGFRGMGQANCPSTEQLQGVVDMNDPCQNPSAGLAVGGLSPSDVSILGIPASVTASAGAAGLTNWLQANAGVLAIAGAGLLGLAFLTKLK